MPLLRNCNGFANLLNQLLYQSEQHRQAGHSMIAMHKFAIAQVH